MILVNDALRALERKLETANFNLSIPKDIVLTRRINDLKSQGMLNRLPAYLFEVFVNDDIY